MPAAERSGLMDRLTRYVIDEALRHQQMWRQRGPRAAGCGERLDAQPARPGVSGGRPGAARPLGRARLVAEPRDHGAHGRRRPGSRRGGAQLAGRLRPEDRDRRLRHGVLVARAAAPAAAARDQDRPLVRAGDDERPRRRGDRALDDRARAQPRAEGDRRGRRHVGDLRRARPARLRRGAGLLSGRSPAGARDRTVARGARPPAPTPRSARPAAAPARYTTDT